MNLIRRKLTAVAVLYACVCDAYVTHLSNNKNIFSRSQSRSKVSLRLSSENADERMPLCKGSYVALVTPLYPDGSVDFDALRNLLEFHLENGTDGLCILGTTGEAATMSMKERESILKVVVEEAKGKLPILVGTGTINPDHVKEQTQQAIDLGCDAALVVTPYYVKPPQRGLVKHFTSIADMGLPLVLYNVPGRTAVDMLPETIALCAEHENIVGVKEATGKVERVEQIRKLCGDDLLLLSGDDSTEAEFVLKGGDGCISVTANVAPRAMHLMIAAALRGDAKEAMRINEKLVMLHKKLFVESNPIPAKWAVKRLGLIPSACCRLPLDEMDEKNYPIVEEALEAGGFI